MACQDLCRILQTFSLPVILFMLRPISSCFAGFPWPFVTLNRRSEPRKNANLCCFSIKSDGLTQKSPMQNFVHLSGMSTWPLWKCWPERTFMRRSQVIFTASNSWWEHLAAFDSMVLSAATVSRLPWGRDDAVSLSRLAWNITVPTFCYNNMLLFSHKSVLIFCKVKFPESKCYQCYLYLCLCSSATSLEGK